jgi:hypothetical protein
VKPFLAVKNWPRFQHYSDRRPPWIKLYVALLDDLEFLELSDTEQISLIKLWMLAARLGHPLPNNPKLLQERAGVRPKALAALIAHRWLELTEDASNRASNGDSTPLAEVEHSASPHARPRDPARASARSREGEVEGENRERTTPPAAARDENWTPGEGVVDSLPSGPARGAYVAYRRSHRHPDAFDAALAKLAEPITGNGFGWEIVGRALAEMHANGKEWHAGLCAGYCKRLKAGPAPKLNGSGRHAARRSRNLEVLAASVKEVEHG